MILRKYRLNYYSRWTRILMFFCLFFTMYYFLTQVSQATVYGLLNIFTVTSLKKPTLNDLNNSNNFLRLQNFADKESELLQSKSRIFFLQTSENPHVLSRHACSIESAARLHPNSSIYVLMQSEYVDLNKGSYRHLQTYQNIHFLHFNEQSIYSGTSLTNLLKSKPKQILQYMSISHLSDTLRTALLYKYGGIYFDLDVIPIRNFDNLTNTVGLETFDGVNVAVLAFERQHIVFDLQMDIQLKSIENQFEAFCWNCLGPLALTQALKNICDYQQLHIHKRDRCHRINIQPSYVFYPISYQEIPKLFRSSSENVNDLLQNSSIYSIHYFHHMTMTIPIEKSSSFAQIASQFCPTIYPHLLNENLPDPSLSHRLILICVCLIVTFFCCFLFHFVIYFRTKREKYHRSIA